MNQNVKKIIALAILCNVFSTITPTTILDLGIHEAYAYSKYQLTSLGLKSGVSIIPIYDSISYKSDTRVTKWDKVPIVAYAKLTSNQSYFTLNNINSSVSSDIRVFVGDDLVKLSDIYSQINISQGETKKVTIRLYDSISATDDNYEEEYEINVTREIPDEDTIIDYNDSISSNTNEEIKLKDYDDIYLNRITLFDDRNEKVDFSFDKTQSIFNISVPDTMKYLNIKAVPEQQSYKLFIDNKQLDPTHDKETKLVSLDKGENIIKIKIINSSSEIREYYLVITRGEKTNSNKTNNKSVNSNNENAQSSGNWQYKQGDGSLAVGWTNIDNQWYYFDTDGSMKTGWFEDTDSKWYYFNQYGIMVKDAVIDGYKLGTDGAFIK